LLEAKELKTIFKVVLDGLANIFAAAEKIGELEKVSLHVRECGAAWMA
jgi:importin subunit alpha-2